MISSISSLIQSWRTSCGLFTPTTLRLLALASLKAWLSGMKILLRHAWWLLGSLLAVSFFGYDNALARHVVGALLLVAAFMVMRSSIVRKTDSYFAQYLIGYALPYMVVKGLLFMAVSGVLMRVALSVLLDYVLLFLVESRSPLRVPVQVLYFVGYQAPLFFVIFFGALMGDFLTSLVPTSGVLAVLWVAVLTVWFCLYSAWVTTFFIRCVYEDTKVYFPVA